MAMITTAARNRDDVTPEFLQAAEDRLAAHTAACERYCATCRELGQAVATYRRMSQPERS